MKTINTFKSTNTNTQVLTNKKSFGNKSIISLLVIGSLMAAPSYANDEYTQLFSQAAEQQKVQKADTNVELGFGSGALIGAVVAGPIGAFVAGLVGTLIAKNVNAQQSINDLSSTLASKKQRIDNVIAEHQKALQTTEQSFQAELLALQSNYTKSAQLQAENLLMSLQFSTGSSEIKPHYQPQVTALTHMLKQSPDLSIDLSGYTDLQGDEALNQALSLARVNAVKQALVKGGVESDRINTFALGESQPVVANSNKEISFYDRRVVIKLHQLATEHTAQNF